MEFLYFLTIEESASNFVNKTKKFQTYNEKETQSTVNKSLKRV